VNSLRTSILTRKGGEFVGVISCTLAFPACRRFHTVEVSPLLQAVIISELSGIMFLSLNLVPTSEMSIENIEV
jgi:hypothetical protein